MFNIKNNKNLSPNQKALLKLVRNKTALFGIFILVSMVLIALFGYWIAPDNTTNANRQILPIKASMPNSAYTILLDRNDVIDTPQHFLSILLKGKREVFIPIPIEDSYKLKNDSIFYNEYKGAHSPSVERKKSMVEILYAIAPESTISKKGNLVEYTDIYNKTQQVSSDELNEKILEQIKRTNYSLGTDNNGRDILSRLIIGASVSLSVGFVSVIISLIIGVFLGSLSGYYRGWVDACIMWLINVFWAIPTILLAMGLMISAKEGISNVLLVFIAVGLTMWVDTARLVRGQFLSLREMEYIQAAKSLGFSDFRTIFHHILPNIIGPLVVITASNFASAILIESGLSYIGLGVQPPAPSWGSMLKEYFGYIGTDRAYLALFPGMAIFILVLAFNVVGNGLRDAFDIKMKTTE